MTYDQVRTDSRFVESGVSAVQCGFQMKKKIILRKWASGAKVLVSKRF